MIICISHGTVVIFPIKGQASLRINRDFTVCMYYIRSDNQHLVREMLQHYNIKKSRNLVTKV